MAGLINLKLLTDFFNKIGQTRSFNDVRAMSVFLPIAIADIAPCRLGVTI